MKQSVQGIHHITAIASDPQANVDFYHHLLGQRLVKTTINFDDPGTYHFYFGDALGTPGTILTFFPWRHMRRGQRGNGEIAATAYAIRPGSMPFWQARLAQHGVTVGALQTRFGHSVLPFEDPDGMILELVTTAEPATVQVWQEGPIPAEHALLGFYAATAWVTEVGPTAELLTTHLGYEFVAQEGNRYRYKGASNDVDLYVDLVERPSTLRGQMGAGTVHHIAFRTVDDAEQKEYLTDLRRAGYHVSPVMDRQYFHSIYFRAPSGVLFEIATDAPGFLYDEPIAELGTNLKLPDWFEPRREQIEAALPPLNRKPVVTAKAAASHA